MKSLTVTTFALAAALAVGMTPLHAKKPDSDESALPRGLQKKVARGGELPPGWQKKLQRGEVLDQAVVSHGGPVSPQLKVKLPVGDKGSVDITLDGKVIRLNEKTRQILEVFEVRL